MLIAGRKRQAPRLAFVPAENDGNADTADAILAKDFVCITRAIGMEQDRGSSSRPFGISLATTRERRRPAPPSGGCHWCLFGHLDGWRSVLDSEMRGLDDARQTPDVVDARFRNTYVFKRDDMGPQSSGDF